MGRNMRFTLGILSVAILLAVAPSVDAKSRKMKKQTEPPVTPREAAAEELPRPGRQPLQAPPLQAPRIETPGETVREPGDAAPGETFNGPLNDRRDLEFAPPEPARSLESRMRLEVREIPASPSSFQIAPPAERRSRPAGGTSSALEPDLAPSHPFRDPFLPGTDTESGVFFPANHASHWGTESPGRELKLLSADKITYRDHGPRKRRVETRETILPVAAPCGCCDVGICVRLPVCCNDAPTTKSRKGLFGRHIVTYCWDCGFEMDVVFTRHGEVVVHSYPD